MYIFVAAEFQPTKYNSFQGKQRKEQKIDWFINRLCCEWTKKNVAVEYALDHFGK